MTALLQRHALRGFTLIEILIVVAILAVLATLLITVIDRVIKSSERVKCSNNLRQLGVAIHHYANDNDGWLPPGHRTNMGGSFSRVLSDYVEPMKSPTMSADVFYCPTNVRLGSPPAAGYFAGYKGWSGYFFNYCINASIFKITNSDVGNSGYVSDNQGRIKLASVLYPGRMVALLDMNTRAPNVSGPPSSTMIGKNYFNPASLSFILGTVHSHTGNILFVDGHVEAFSRQEPLSVMSLPSQEQPWWP